MTSLKLSVFCAASSFAISSSFIHAFEVLDTPRDKGELYGKFAADYINSDDLSEFADSLSRVGLRFTRKLDHDWIARAGFEWGMDIINTDDSLALSGDALRAAGDQNESVWQRLGYVGVQHPKWGSFSVGKQWSTYYDVTKVTDVLNTFSGKASGTFNFDTDGGVSGTGRAEQVLQWRKSFYDIDIGLQVQATDDTIEVEDNDLGIDGEGELDTSMGGSLKYTFANNIQIGFAVNLAEYEFPLETGQTVTVDDRIWALGANWGTRGQAGIYTAVVYSQSEGHETDNLGHLFDAKGLEAYFQYRFVNNVSVYLGYNHLQEDDEDYGSRAGDEYELQFSVLGIAYDWAPDFKLYIEYKIEDTSLAYRPEDGGVPETEDDTLSIGVSFDF